MKVIILTLLTCLAGAAFVVLGGQLFEDGFAWLGIGLEILGVLTLVICFVVNANRYLENRDNSEKQ